MDSFDIHDHMTPEEISAFDTDMTRMGDGEVLPSIGFDEHLTLHRNENIDSAMGQSESEIDIDITVEQYQEMVDTIRTHNVDDLDSDYFNMRTTLKDLEEIQKFIKDQAQLTDVYDHRHIDHDRDTSLGAAENEMQVEDITIPHEENFEDFHFSDNEDEIDVYSESMVYAGDNNQNEQWQSDLQEYRSDENGEILGLEQESLQDEEDRRIREEEVKKEEERLRKEYDRKQELASNILESNKSQQDRAIKIREALENCNYQFHDQEPKYMTVGKLIVTFNKQAKNFGIVLGNKEAEIDIQQTNSHKLIELVCNSRLEKIGTGMHREIEKDEGVMVIGGGAYIYLGDRKILVGNQSGDFGKMDKTIVTKCLESAGYSLLVSGDNEYTWGTLETRQSPEPMEPGSGAAKWVGDFLAGKTEQS